MYKTNERKFDVFRLHYFHGATRVGKYELPQLKSTQIIPREVVKFSDRKKINEPEHYALHFFLDDYRCECFWKDAERYFDSMRNFQAIISTDYSMFPEMLEGQRIWNCTRNRVMAYYLQKNEFNVIPVASWCNMKDFDWCFDGLPEESSIAVSSNGCLRNPYGLKIFIIGFEELQKRKRPSNIILYGREMPEINQYKNVIYYPNHYESFKSEEE